MTMQMSLRENERAAIVNALHVAAEVFDRDAAKVVENQQLGPIGEDTAALGRLAKQFRDQATFARAWAEKLENAEEVTIR